MPFMSWYELRLSARWWAATVFRLWVADTAVGQWRRKYKDRRTGEEGHPGGESWVQPEADHRKGDVMAGWNAALCEDCWADLNPDRIPVRLRDTRHETCSNCGLPTKSGIYVRMRPGDQNFPTAERIEA